MKTGEVEHIISDVVNALLENRYDDPTLAQELIGEFFAHVGALASGGPEAWQDAADRNPGLTTAEYVEEFAENLLRRCQIRAISAIPFEAIGAPFYEEEDHR